MSEQAAATVPDYNWKTIPVRESRKGIMQRVFRGNDVLIGYSELHPHMDPSPHSHPYEQIFMIVQGRVKLHVGEQVIQCTPGSVVRIPPNVVHWAEPPSPEDGVAINMDIWTVQCRLRHLAAQAPERRAAHDRARLLEDPARRRHPAPRAADRPPQARRGRFPRACG